MGRNRAIRLIQCAILSCAVIVAWAAGCAAEDFVFGVHFASGGGFSSSQMYDTTCAIMEALTENADQEWVTRKFESEDAVKEAMIAGRLDAAWSYPFYISQMVDRGAAPMPLFTFVSGGNRKEASCLWSRKGARGNQMDDISGKTLAITDHDEMGTLLPLREHLTAKGIDMPLWKVFGSFVKISGPNSAFIALAMGKVDFVWDSDDYRNTLKLINPGILEKLEYGSCTDHKFGRGMLVINKKRLSSGEVEEILGCCRKFQAEFEGGKRKEPGLQWLKSYMKLADMKIIVADEKEFAADIELYMRSKKNGWLDEAEKIIGILKTAQPGKPMSIKMDYDYCKEFCAGKKDEMKCLDDCMGE